MAPRRAATASFTCDGLLRDVRGREAVLLHHDLDRRRRAEATLDADHGAERADVAVPAQRHAGLDRHAREDRRRQDRVAVRRGWASNSSHDGRLTTRAATPSPGEQPPAPRRPRETSEPVAIRITSGCPRRRRARSAVARRRRAAGQDRQRLPREQQRHRPALSSRPARPRPSRSRRGRITRGCGIARSEAACSTGWCVGPSSPTPMLSWVKTKIDAQLHERREADRRAHVVGERQEGGREGDQAAVERDAGRDRGHGVLADAEVEVAAGVAPVAADRPLAVVGLAAGLEVARALERRVGRGVEVGRAADELGHTGRERV